MGVCLDDRVALHRPGGLEPAMARHFRHNLDALSDSVLCKTHQHSPHFDSGSLASEELPERFNLVACCEDAVKRARAALQDRPAASSLSDK